MRTSLLRIIYLSATAVCLVGGVAQAQGRGNGGTPPGLAKKDGLPPGQAKKLYRPDDGVIVLRDVFSRHGYRIIRTANDGDARIVFYRLGNGSLRRAVVRPGTEQLIFINVPSVLLHEVLGRLY
ncbi:MAG TPA: hypothetical protein VGP84_22400 [Gemmatimonadaceae bacterium]|jgi:hypothetical protein|nr:hypothetical protein [Gemmatimonadaceae bacterium]